VTHPTTRKLSGLALAAAFVFGACTSGATQSPANSQPAASDQASTGPTTPLPPTGSVTLNGAGATFPALLYQVWIEKISEASSNVSINYQANGSGAGIKAITQQTVDFGASDAAMKDAEIAALPTGTRILHFPTALGAVVVIFNIKGLDGNPITKLNLDAANVAGIFLGHIRTWNDPAIVANNPDVASNLPPTPILTIHRSDGSGTTNAFTSYLDAVSPEWHAGVGAGKSVNWPTGNGAPGNDGVSGSVKQSDGAVGYVELQYGVVSGLSSAAIKNAAGKFVAGSSQGVTDAANAVLASFPADFRQAPIIDAAGDTSYPIASYTYLLVYANQADATKGQTLVAFIYWALTAGQKEEKAIGYAPLPDSVDQKAIAELHMVTTGGSAIWP
jgi:phosphate transport system substrate-binding protein